MQLYRYLDGLIWFYLSVGPLLQPTFHSPHCGMCASCLHMSEPCQLRLTHLVYHRGYIHLVLDNLTLFLIPSLLVCQHIYLNNLISTALILWTCQFLTGQYFPILYSQSDHHFIMLPLRLGGTLLLHETIEASFHFNYFTLIRGVISSSVSPFLWIIDHRYLKFPFIRNDLF